MPYIKKEEREKVKVLLNSLCSELKTKGQYNYVISYLLHNYIKTNGLKYEHLNDAMGIIECVKQEFYRTVAAPYEDIKKKENGDITLD